MILTIWSREDPDGKLRGFKGYDYIHPSNPVADVAAADARAQRLSGVLTARGQVVDEAQLPVLQQRVDRLAFDIASDQVVDEGPTSEEQREQRNRDFAPLRDQSETLVAAMASLVSKLAAGTPLSADDLALAARLGEVTEALPSMPAPQDLETPVRRS